MLPPGVTRMFDIGSGGGSPALPLALSIPGVRLVMVESKTRKSVFLREAVRALDLTGAEVVTARFEELLSRPDLHETQDLVTIRAVRLEASLFTSVQAFTKPKGVVFLFRSTNTDVPGGTLSPLLTWKATYPLLAPHRSSLMILEKRSAVADERRYSFRLRICAHSATFHVEHQQSSLDYSLDAKVDAP